MTLQDFAANETSTLIGRLLARRADALREQLRAMNEALNDIERAAEAPLELDHELEELTGRLNRAFGEEIERIRNEGRAALENAQRGYEAALQQLRADLSDTRLSLDTSMSRLADVDGELDMAHRENARLRDALAAAHDANDRLDADRRRAEDSLAAKMETETAVQLELEDARRSLDEAFADIARLGADLEASAAEKGRLTIELGTARGELQMAVSQRDAVAAQLKASLGRAQMRGRGQDTGDLAPVRSDAAMSIAPEVSSSAGIVPGSDDAVKLTATIDAAVRSVEELTGASSTADLLGRLAQQLSTEFCRVALFRVHGNRLQGEHQVGFDYTTEVRKIAMPLSVDSLLTRVVSSKEVERLNGHELADESKGAPFRGSPTLALALPVLLRGDAIAVAYVDNWDQQASAPGRGSDDRSALFARLVIRQAGVLFIGLAHEMRTLTELREYAAALLKGAEQMYSADVDARISAEALRNRLEDNLACARQLFSQRAALEGPAAAGLLEEQLAATIEADPSAPFVRDLAAIRVREHEASRSAEAC